MVIRNILVAASLFLVASPAPALRGEVGQVVTDATFITAYGQRLSFRELRGDVVVLTYWMGKCSACDDQVNTLDLYYRQRQNVGLKVMAISTDVMNDRELRNAFKDKLVHPVRSVRGPFELLEDFPTTYVIDRNGQIRYVTEKQMGIDKLNEILVPLLREPQP
jgi:cytochrome c biogenesis protein CcmG/thiol:disulfide interchange protein DsbE